MLYTIYMQLLWWLCPRGLEDVHGAGLAHVGGQVLYMPGSNEAREELDACAARVLRALIA